MIMGVEIQLKLDFRDGAALRGAFLTHCPTQKLSQHRRAINTLRRNVLAGKRFV